MSAMGGGHAGDTLPTTSTTQPGAGLPPRAPAASFLMDPPDRLAAGQEPPRHDIARLRVFLQMCDIEKQASASASVASPASPERLPLAPGASASSGATSSPTQSPERADLSSPHASGSLSQFWRSTLLPLCSVRFRPHLTDKSPGPKDLFALSRCCPNLKKLSLQNLSLTPPALEALLQTCGSNLQYLNIASATGLTSELLGLISSECVVLRRLRLADTGVTNTGLTALASHWCAHLQSLDLAGCLIDDDGMEILAKEFLHLTALHVSRCPNITNEGLEKVAASCLRLQELHIQNCHGITSLPVGLSRLKGFHDLQLTPSLMQFPPPDTLRLGTAAIMEYLRDFEEEAVPCHMLKVLLVGSKASGKSTLATAMRQAAGRRKDAGETTAKLDLDPAAGVDVSWWEPNPFDAAHPLQVSMWDTAGHVLFPFFSCDQAMHMVVFNLASAHDAAWTDLLRDLQMVYARAPSAKVLLVGTHLDELPDQAAAAEVLFSAVSAASAWIDQKREESLTPAPALPEGPKATTPPRAAPTRGFSQFDLQADHIVSSPAASVLSSPGSRPLADAVSSFRVPRTASMLESPPVPSRSFIRPLSGSQRGASSAAASSASLLAREITSPLNADDRFSAGDQAQPLLRAPTIASLARLKRVKNSFRTSAEFDSDTLDARYAAEAEYASQSLVFDSLHLSDPSDDRQARFEMAIIGSAAVSAITGDGLDELLATIVESAYRSFPHVGQQVPRKYLQLMYLLRQAGYPQPAPLSSPTLPTDDRPLAADRDLAPPPAPPADLLTLRRLASTPTGATPYLRAEEQTLLKAPFLSWAQFRHIAAQVSFSGEAQLRRAANFLHALGVIVHVGSSNTGLDSSSDSIWGEAISSDSLSSFESSGSEFVFLDPFWINSAIKRLISHQHSLSTSSGPRCTKCSASVSGFRRRNRRVCGRCQRPFCSDHCSEKALVPMRGSLAKANVCDYCVTDLGLMSIRHTEDSPFHLRSRPGKPRRNSDDGSGLLRAVRRLLPRREPLPSPSPARSFFFADSFSTASIGGFPSMITASSGLISPSSSMFSAAASAAPAPYSEAEWEADVEQLSKSGMATLRFLCYHIWAEFPPSAHHALLSLMEAAQLLVRVPLPDSGTIRHKSFVSGSSVFQNSSAPTPSTPVQLEVKKTLPPSLRRWRRRHSIDSAMLGSSTRSLLSEPDDSLIDIDHDVGSFSASDLFLLGRRGSGGSSSIAAAASASAAAASAASASASIAGPSASAASSAITLSSVSAATTNATAVVAPAFAGRTPIPLGKISRPGLGMSGSVRFSAGAGAGAGGPVVPPDPKPAVSVSSNAFAGAAGGAGQAGKSSASITNPVPLRESLHVLSRRKLSVPSSPGPSVLATSANGADLFLVPCFLRPDSSPSKGKAGGAGGAGTTPRSTTTNASTTHDSGAKGSGYAMSYLQRRVTDATGQGVIGWNPTAPGMKLVLRRRFMYRYLPVGYFSQLQAQWYSGLWAQEVAHYSPTSALLSLRKSKEPPHLGLERVAVMVSRDSHGVWFLDVVGWYQPRETSQELKASSCMWTLLGTVLTSIRDMHRDSWPGLSVEEFVPCPHCAKEDDSDDVQLFPTRELVTSLSQGFLQTGCDRVVTHESAIDDMLHPAEATALAMALPPMPSDSDSVLPCVVQLALVDEKTGRITETGSGFFVHSAGLVLTAAHILLEPPTLSAPAKWKVGATCPDVIILLGVGSAGSPASWLYSAEVVSSLKEMAPHDGPFLDIAVLRVSHRVTVTPPQFLGFYSQPLSFVCDNGHSIVPPDPTLVAETHMVGKSRERRVFHQCSPDGPRAPAAPERLKYSVLRSPPVENFKTKHFLRLGDSSSLKFGQDVLTVGYPRVVGGTQVVCVFDRRPVSAFNDSDPRVNALDPKGCIWTRACIDHGSSGGPVLDARHRVVGVQYSSTDPAQQNYYGYCRSMKLAYPFVVNACKALRLDPPSIQGS